MSYRPNRDYWIPGFGRRGGSFSPPYPHALHLPLHNLHSYCRCGEGGQEDYNSYPPSLDRQNPNSMRIETPRTGFAYPRAKFNSQCNDSDGQNFCDCQENHSYIDQCMYYGRHVEPLAFSLADKPIAPQWLCPLFSKIPIEIREMVYEYAFIDCNSMPLDWNNPYRDHPITHHEGIDHGKHIPHSDISFNFLQTCRAVYLEAYQLPLLLNPFIVYRFGSLPSYDVTRPRFVQLAPWQFALIQRLDISLQQIALEGDQLAKYLKIWKAKERHEGALVAPRFYQESRNTYPGVIIQSFNFGIIPYHNPLEDSVAISLKNKRTFYSRNRSSYPVVSTARAMIARPLTHLTLRLSRTDWRTWTDSDMGDPTRELGLDPAFGDGGSGVTERPTAARMQYLAAERRANRWPGQQPNDDGTSSYRYISGWGAEIAKLPDLKTLELVLETFDTKKLQLETVADCAKTWIFPLEGTQHQLVWDGKIEALRYQCYDESSTLTNGTQRVLQQISSPPYSPTVEWTEVRIIRFRRRKVQ